MSSSSCSSPIATSSATPTSCWRNLSISARPSPGAAFRRPQSSLTVAELFDILKITKQSLGRVLKQLIDDGYVARRAAKIVAAAAGHHRQGPGVGDDLAALQPARIARRALRCPGHPAALSVSSPPLRSCRPARASRGAAVRLPCPPAALIFTEVRAMTHGRPPSRRRCAPLAGRRRRPPDPDAAVAIPVRRWLPRHDGGDRPDARPSRRGCAFDLLILDVMMPGESGFDLARDLREYFDVPILMLTAQTRRRRSHPGPDHRRRRLPLQAVRAESCCCASATS